MYVARLFSCCIVVWKSFVHISAVRLGGHVSEIHSSSSKMMVCISAAAIIRLFMKHAVSLIFCANTLQIDVSLITCSIIRWYQQPSHAQSLFFHQTLTTAAIKRTLRSARHGMCITIMKVIPQQHIVNESRQTKSKNYLFLFFKSGDWCPAIVGHRCITTDRILFFCTISVIC